MPRVDIRKPQRANLGLCVMRRYLETRRALFVAHGARVSRSHLVKEGDMLKVCNGGPRKYKFVLFSDMLVYGTETMRAKLQRDHRKYKASFGRNLSARICVPLVPSDSVLKARMLTLVLPQALSSLFPYPAYEMRRGAVCFYPFHTEVANVDGEWRSRGLACISFEASWLELKSGST